MEYSISIDMEQPRISIGMTTYDRTELLRESVLSILNQNYKNFTLVISNDNPERVLTLENLNLPFDSRIIIVNQRINLGEIANLNWLMNYAEAPYFTWLADDDLLHPDYLRIMVNELNKDPKLPAVFSNYIHGPVPSERFYAAVVPAPITLKSDKFLELYSARELSLIGCYGLFKIEELRRIGGFRKLGKGFSPASDTLIPLLIASEFDIRYIDSPIVFLRTHQTSVSSSSTDLNAYISAELDFLLILRTVVSKFPKKLGNQVIENFCEWFSDNHLTVIYRQRNLRTLGKLIQFFRIELTTLRYLTENRTLNMMSYRLLANSVKKFLIRFAQEKINLRVLGIKN
jgi:glycosyltransferase involved in cell wall biosynthesis